MLVIRFQRVGRKNDPAFRIVVTERRSKPKSGELEVVGSFHPKTKEVRLKAERISHWLARGAQSSPRVHNLLVAEGVIRGKKIDVSKGRPKAMAEPPAATQTAVEAHKAPRPEPPPAVDAAATAG